jgi:alpha-tubulin suppressor-like RCC1 family protein
MAVIINSGWTVGGGWYGAGYNFNQLNAWGNNSYGQLGLNTTTALSSPAQVGTSNLWQSISDGYNFSAGLQSPGTLWMWGNNSWGQLGTSNQINYSSPVQIAAPTFSTTASWKSIASGLFQLAVQSNGTLWSCGYNFNYQLGLGDATSRSSFIQVGTTSTWTQVSNGLQNSYAIQSNGTLWVWGSNQNGALGNNTTITMTTPVQLGSLSNWTQVYGGYTRAFAIQSPGTLWAWGNNQYGVLGLNDTINRSSPVQVGALTTWTQVALGLYHTVGVLSNGTLYGWGYNFYGQLGQLNITDRSSPVQIGVASNWVSVGAGWYTTFAIQNTGTLWACGYNNIYGQFGNNSTAGTSSLIQIGTLSNWAQVTGGQYSTAAIQSNGTLWAWGNNSHGQLGVNTTTANISSPVQVGALTNWTRVNMNISAFPEQTTALNASGTLYSWGGNTYGALGLNTNTLQTSSPNIVLSSLFYPWAQVSAGGYHTLAIQSNGTLWAWGNNTFGNQLGINTTTIIYQTSPAQVGGLSLWTQVSAGWVHSLALQTNGTLWAWGNNSYGTLGNNSNNNISSPLQIGSNSNWSQISSGTYWSMGLQSNGTLWSWGINTYGQLGLNTTTAFISSPTQIGALTVWAQIPPTVGTAGYAIKNDGTLWAWGNNSYGQLGNNTSPFNILSPIQVGNGSNWSQVYIGIGAGASVLAIQSNGTLWAWGANGFGQLGLNTSTVSISSPVQVGALTTWVKASAGTYYGTGISYT